jgi:hypothetical protein
LKKLKGYKKLVNTLKRIQKKNESDKILMLKLEDAIEKNQIMLKLNYKDHLNRVLEKKLIISKMKTIKDNKEGKKGLGK